MQGFILSIIRNFYSVLFISRYSLSRKALLITGDSTDREKKRVGGLEGTFGAGMDIPLTPSA